MKKIIHGVLCFGFITALLSACDDCDWEPEGNPRENPRTCPEGEVYSTCPPSSDYCPLEDPNRNPIVTPAVCGKPRCVCGFNRKRSRKTNKCIAASACRPFPCRKHEKYNSCPASCPGEKCADYINNSTCPRFRIGVVVACEPQCRCAKGYYRDGNNHCVPAAQCKATSCNGDPNAHPGCGINCGRTCATYQNASNVACILVCKENGCDCNDGYVLDENTKLCVRPEQCTRTCPEGEVYSTCPPSSDYCPLEDPNRNPVVTPAVCGKPRCVCGFNRKRSRKTNKCIAASACRPFPCRKHEKYNSCPASCPGEKCSDYINNSTCPRFGRIGVVVACEPQCRCAKGYYRDGNNHCVPAAQCQALSCNRDPNAHPGCGVNCGRTCRTYQNAASISCILLCNENGCDCNDGYVLNEDTHLCVLPEDCPKCSNGDPNGSPGCGINCGRTCSTYQSTEQVFCTDICEENGCDCNVGFVLDERTGRCLRPEDCSTPTCPPDEVWESCPLPCPPQICSTIWSRYDCTEANANYTCKGQCRCKDGFYRNAIGQCISTENCLKCRGPNEYFSCGVACDNVCFNLEIQNQTSCPIINVVCNQMCYCKEGYARNKENICVKYKDCPPKCTGKNEVYSTCASGCEKTCDSIGAPENETCIAPAVCLTACVCQEGYYRNGKGKCVPKSECTSCGNDPNQVPGCGVYCGQLCSDVGRTTPRPCPRICKVNSCDCKPGFYLDENTKKCVNECDCPAKID